MDDVAANDNGIDEGVGFHIGVGVGGSVSSKVTLVVSLSYRKVFVFKDKPDRKLGKDKKNK